MTEQKFQFEPGPQQAQELDRSDPLAHFREQFHIPKHTDGKDCIYLCGNSLGLQAKATAGYVQQELKDWERLGVEGHFHAENPWLPYHELLTNQLAQVVGAKPVEVVAMNTLTVNLHLMLVSFYRPTASRFKLLSCYSSFPSDRYALASQAKFHGYDPKEAIIVVEPKPGQNQVYTEDIEQVLLQHGEEIALVIMDGVNYYSGQALEFDRITKAAHSQGCRVGFDLAHAAGNLDLQLHQAGPDFAVWCSYKYLNGGPGCVAGCFVHERHAHDTSIPRFAGWWGHDKETRFQMGPQFEAIAGAEGWQLSNPPILPLACLRASLDLFEQAGMPQLREKSKKLTAYLQYLIDNLDHDNILVITPQDPDLRGCQLSLRVKRNGKQVHQRLISAGVICDWREPDVVRIAAVPLYNTFLDVFKFVDILKEV